MNGVVKNDRQQQLMARLSVVQKLSLAEAMELLNVSESTARRMFAKLERDGLAIRTHGGVQSVSGAMTGYSFEYGARTNIERKTAIAKYAASCLEDGDVVFCDSGTTIQCLCAQIACRIQKEGLNIKLYTNSLANLEMLSPHMQVNLVGGEYRGYRKDFCGYLTEQALQGLRFTKSFVGADGCVGEGMFTTTDFDTACMNQIAIRNTEKTFMLADSSKFGISSHVVYTTLNDLHTVITDNAVEPGMLQQLQGSKAQVVCVEYEEK